MHWNNLEWVELKKQLHNNNSFCSVTHTFYIKYGNELYRFFVQYKLKPIDYDALLKCKELSAALKAGIGSNKVTKKKNNYSTTSSAGVKDTYD